MSIDKQARDVSRYDLVSGYMQRWTDGEFVYHSDYLELLDELEAAEKRIAELEAREINLPPNELVTDTWTSPGDGWEVFDAQKVIDSIRSAGVRIAAGISVKGE